MKIVLAGLPGKIASEIARTIDGGLLHTAAVTSERHAGAIWQEQQSPAIRLLTAHALAGTLSPSERYVALDFSPKVIEHIPLWAELKIPAVIGGTAFDAAKAREAVVKCGSVAVFAPNLAEPIVALQAILRKAATEFPGAFQGFSWSCVESHQATKKDVSGTARSLLPTFSALGFVGANVENIKSIRDGEAQKQMGVPEQYLSGHGWHRYEGSHDGVTIALEHRTNGRSMYVTGALKACKFALVQSDRGSHGGCFDMVDVVRWTE